jgi:aspartyl-tRNA(Asn)/glutamyl-tRNA(Gln) amidotransferase subunit A
VFVVELEATLGWPSGTQPEWRVHFRFRFTFFWLIVTMTSALIAKTVEKTMAKPLHWMSARKLRKGFAAQKFSPVDVAKACLAQIYKHDGALNAMCHLDEKTTLTMAENSAKRWGAGKALGPLDGVPVLIKDLLLTKGWPTLRGSKTKSREGPWDHDAPSVQRLREAGAVFMGHTTTPEFGWKGVTDSPLTGITRNPWNPALTPGGSSGGSAAGLAAGYAPLALGTDGGGSIRIPAGFTGTFGLKPSFGRVPAWPLSPFGTVAHIGPMTRTVEDAALMLNAIAKPDARDWYALPPPTQDYSKKLEGRLKGMRIAYSPNLGYVNVDPEVAQLVSDAVGVLKKLGAKIVEVHPGFKDPAPIFRVLWWTSVRTALSGLSDAQRDMLDPALANVYEQAQAYGASDIAEANLARGELGSHMRQFMQDYDVLITPTLPITAFEAGKLQPDDPDAKGKWVNWTPFTYPFNLTQQPAASVPCGFTKVGLPVGLHLIGRMFDDHTVLRVSAAYEAKTKFYRRHPNGY